MEVEIKLEDKGKLEELGRDLASLVLESNSKLDEKKYKALIREKEIFDLWQEEEIFNFDPSKISKEREVIESKGFCQSKSIRKKILYSAFQYYF